jgi:hypothetical protein
MTESELGVERRLARLEARQEITALVSAYCVAMDDRDLLRLAALFAPDGRFQSRNGMTNAVGRPEIRALYKSRFAGLGPSYHWTHDHSVSFDDDGHAHGLVLGHVESWLGDTAYIGALRYEDRYVRLDGTWMFAGRMLSYLYYAPVNEYAQVLGSPLRMRSYGKRLPADYPEGLATWTSWREAPDMPVSDAK